MKRRLIAGVLCMLACKNDGREPLVVPPLEFSLREHWPERTDYPGVGAGRIVITNNGDDTVSLFDLSRVGEPDFRELKRVPVGLVPVEPEGPHHAAMAPAGDYYYVGISNFVPAGGSGPHGAHGTGTADGYVLKHRASDNNLVASVRVDRNPGDLALTRDGQTLYVTHFDLLKIVEAVRTGGSERDMDARLAVVDANTMTLRKLVPLCPGPHGMRFSADEQRAYIACYSDEVAVVQLDDPTYPVTRVKVGADAGSATSPVHEPYALMVSPSSGDIWVSCLRSRSVRVLDGQTHELKRVVTLDGAPIFGAFTRDGALLYLPHQGDDRVSIIQADTGAILRRIELRPAGCLNAHHVEFTPDEQFVLVICEGDHRGPGSLHVVDRLSDAVLQSVPVGVFPDFVGFLRGGAP